MRNIIICATLLLCLSVITVSGADRRISASPSQQSASDRRIALVIGNSAYRDAPLRNPVNDANAMAESLKQAGFEVILKTNANRKEMNALVRDFGDRLLRGGMGLFYFAGHGMQVGGKNYLIPVGAEIQREDEVPDESVPADLVLRKMETANNGLNLVIMDACRNNPFARSFRSSSQGLGRMEAPGGTLLVYATRPGSTAADGDGENGVFTKHFLAKMKQPGLDLANLVGEVSDAVEKETRKAQQPWIEGNLKGSRFYFYGPVTVQQAPAVHAGAVELQFWQSAEKSNTATAYRAYLNKYPKGEFADLARERLNTLEVAASSSRTEQERLARERQEAEHKAREAEQRAAAAERRAAEERARAEAAERARAEAASRPAAIAPAASSSASLTDPITGMEFVSVPGGCFQMGDTFGDGESDEKPVHEVCVGSFMLGKYEVTQGQWKKVMGNNPSKNTSWFSSTDDYPVEQVSWDDAQEFIKKLNHQSGRNYRLPTEAEWEYAARSGGKKEKYAGGDDIDAVAWYGGNSGSKTHQIGQKQANGLGLYDMSGNVWEWVSDWYGMEYYANSPKDNPQGPSSGAFRVFRGGGWRDVPARVRASYRNSLSPDYRRDYLGFRLVAPVQ